MSQYGCNFEAGITDKMRNQKVMELSGHAGGSIGAVAGAPLGPIGMCIGWVIGIAIGVVAGDKLDQAVNGKKPG